MRSCTYFSYVGNITEVARLLLESNQPICLLSLVRNFFIKKHATSLFHIFPSHFRLIPFDNEVLRPQGPQLKLLQKMRKDLVQLNNGYLQKRGVFVDENIATMPYFVTDKLNKKKKQPSEVRMTKHLIGKALDHYLEQICLHGQLQPKHYEPKILNCR